MPRSSGRTDKKAARAQAKKAERDARGQFADHNELAYFFWRVHAFLAWWEDEAFGEQFLSLNLHVRPPVDDGRDQRRLFLGGRPGAPMGEYALGSHGPRLGSSDAPWDEIWEVGGLQAYRRDPASGPHRIAPWPRPPPGFSGPLKELPRSGVRARLVVAPGPPHAVRLRLTGWSVLGHEMFDPNDMITWDWTGLSEAAEDAMLARREAEEERYLRSIGEIAEDESYEAQFLDAYYL